MKRDPISPMLRAALAGLELKAARERLTEGERRGYEALVARIEAKRIAADRDNKK